MRKTLKTESSVRGRLICPYDEGTYEQLLNLNVRTPSLPLEVVAMRRGN